MYRTHQFLVLLFLPYLAFAQEKVSVQWEDGKAKSILVYTSALKHYPPFPDSVSFFNVMVQGEKISILGSREIVNDGLKFTPLWPLSNGEHYQVYWKDKLVDTILIPAGKGLPPTLKVFPGADSLPENLLKFYILFSKPMHEGSSIKHIRILDEKNDTLQNVLLELKPELWSMNHMMLTVWIDPGRIKRDLLLNQELGKPMAANKKYSLVILPGWKDIDGIPISASFRKDFIALQADREKPSVKSWKITEPDAQTKSPVVINFPEPMDYATEIRGIDIYSGTQNVSGSVRLIENERKWIFTPEAPWSVGKYRIEVSSYVEDLAGNNLERLFDNDLAQDTSALENQNKIHSIDFEID